MNPVFRRFAMRRIVFSLILTASFLTFWAGAPVFAQTGGQAYVVADVQAEATDESSVKARNKAFDQAQTSAFKKLAARLGQTVTTEPDSRTISSLVKDFEIKNEQISRKSYRGTFTFRFREASVNRYFGIGDGYGAITPAISVPQTALSGQILVLPFITAKKTSILWDKDKNEYWKSLVAKTTETHIVYPQGTVLDSTDVWEKDPTLLSMSSIRKIRLRYGVDQVIVAVMRGGEDKRIWMIDLYRTDRDRVELVRTLPVSLVRQNERDTLFTNAAVTTLVGIERLQSEEAIVELPAAPAETELPVQYPQPLEPSPEISPVAEPVATTPVMAAPPSSTIRVVAQLRSLRDWTSLQGALKSSPALSGYKIISLKTSEAELELGAKNWKQGSADLVRGGYIVQLAIDGSYRISR